MFEGVGTLYEKDLKYFGTFDGKYVGEFKGGKKHGQGTYYYNDGERYEGEWKDGERHGQGSLYDNYDNIGIKLYEGKWEDDKENGYGTYYYENGARYEGEFKDGELHGQGQMFFSDGSTKVGRFEHDQLVEEYPSGTSASYQTSVFLPVTVAITAVALPVGRVIYNRYQASRKKQQALAAKAAKITDTFNIIFNCNKTLQIDETHSEMRLPLTQTNSNEEDFTFKDIKFTQDEMNAFLKTWPIPQSLKDLQAQLEKDFLLSNTFKTKFYAEFKTKQLPLPQNELKIIFDRRENKFKLTYTGNDTTYKIGRYEFDGTRELKFDLLSDNTESVLRAASIQLARFEEIKGMNINRILNSISRKCALTPFDKEMQLRYQRCQEVESITHLENHGILQY